MAYNGVNFLKPSEVRTFLAEQFAHMSDRYKHVLEVTRNVRNHAEMLQRAGVEVDLELAECAALVHDIGYIDELKDTGFHPIDGARFLKQRGFSELADIIVCHSNSPEQVKLLGLESIPVSKHIVASLVTYWDVRVLQGGKVVSYDERLADIESRYSSDHVVYQAHKLAEPRIRMLIAEVDALVNS